MSADDDVIAEGSNQSTPRVSLTADIHNASYGHVSRPRITKGIEHQLGRSHTQLSTTTTQ